jgi:hypothetical protein
MLSFKASRRMRWAGHVAHMRDGRGTYRVLVGKRDGKRSHGRPRHRSEDNIKMNFKMWLGEAWAGLL